MNISSNPTDFDNAQQYTMKSMTLNNIADTKSEATSLGGAFGLYYQGGAILQQAPQSRTVS